MTRYLKNMEKEIIINNQLSEISRITQFIEEIGMSLRMPADFTMSINLAIEEAISNIIKHAYPNNEIGEIILRVNFAPEELTFIIIDEGKHFDLTKIKVHETPLSLEQQLNEGLGLFLIRRTMDKISYTTIATQNYLVLSKKIKNTFQTDENSIKINICTIEEITILSIEGRLDTVNAHKFESAIQELLKEEIKNIIINCEGMTYISSSGLRSLILLQKSIVYKSGSLILEAMKPDIRKIFDLTGCTTLFTIR